MADREWVNPKYEEVIKYYVGQMRETATRRGIRGCNNCHGLRVIVVINPTTKEAFKAPCTACNPDGK
ncbi:hypothetical protein [Streptomyces noursei]|uniref:Uncharacterized protein n=1 Tax=Streptomyces noursei TaxID=1971 RepID=A0A401QY75_STRNR|nr:hypothetical protein [Streptomyces noursei]UWS71504.1 hypothetical protein N1H47_09775 [Streptomyces noursei]GCB90326.1 hypothetical protein SALB_03030 [Streptomyces noursei]